MFCQVLAKEEPSIVALAVKPGVVDTEMQTVLRAQGQHAMLPEDFAKFQSMHQQRGLLSPQQPAQAIARLALEPATLSKYSTGSCIAWNDVQE